MTRAERQRTHQQLMADSVTRVHRRHRRLVDGNVGASDQQRLLQRARECRSPFRDKRRIAAIKVSRDRLVKPVGNGPCPPSAPLRRAIQESLAIEANAERCLLWPAFGSDTTEQRHPILSALDQVLGQISGGLTQMWPGASEHLADGPLLGLAAGGGSPAELLDETAERRDHAVRVALIPALGINEDHLVVSRPEMRRHLTVLPQHAPTTAPLLLLDLVQAADGVMNSLAKWFEQMLAEIVEERHNQLAKPDLAAALEPPRRQFNGFLEHGVVQGDHGVVDTSDEGLDSAAHLLEANGER